MAKYTNRARVLPVPRLGDNFPVIRMNTTRLLAALQFHPETATNIEELNE
jgi:hypothetical protein